MISQTQMEILVIRLFLLLFIAVVMGTQFFVLNTPIRLFHVIYGYAPSLLYALNTYISFKFDERRRRF